MSRRQARTATVAVVSAWVVLHALYAKTVLAHDSWNHVFPILFSVSRESSCLGWPQWLSQVDTGSPHVIHVISSSITQVVRVPFLYVMGCLQLNVIPAAYLYKVADIRRISAVRTGDVRSGPGAVCRARQRRVSSRRDPLRRPVPGFLALEPGRQHPILGALDCHRSDSLPPQARNAGCPLVSRLGGAPGQSAVPRSVSTPDRSGRADRGRHLRRDGAARRCSVVVA